MGEESIYGACRICGCTDDNPCFNPNVGNCWWTDESHTLCSHCEIEVISTDPETVHCINDMPFDNELANQEDLW